MAARRSLAQLLGTEEPTQEAPPAKWGWRPCEGCGAVFLAPEGRTHCLTCRLPGAKVIRVGRGRTEDEIEEGEDEMAQGLGIDTERVASMIKRQQPAALSCHTLGVTAVQFAHWCYRNHVKYPGVPTPNTAAVAALQAEIDRLEQAPVSTQSPAQAIAAQIRAAVDVEAAAELEQPQPAPEEAPAVEQTAAIAPVPEAAPVPVTAVSPFRSPVREGGLVLPIRIEGNRIFVIDEWMVDGDITDVEAELALSKVRDILQGRGNIEVVVEPCA